MKTITKEDIARSLFSIYTDTTADFYMLKLILNKVNDLHVKETYNKNDKLLIEIFPEELKKLNITDIEDLNFSEAYKSFDKKILSINIYSFEHNEKEHIYAKTINSVFTHFKVIYKTEFNGIKDKEPVYIDPNNNKYYLAKRIYEESNIKNIEKIQLYIRKDMITPFLKIYKNFYKTDFEKIKKLTDGPSKMLYRVFQYYENTGNIMLFTDDYSKFRHIMQLECENRCNQIKLENNIIKPAIQELSQIFKNLQYTIHKIPRSNNPKYGTKVVGITFSFENNKGENNE